MFESRLETVEGREKKDLGKLGWKLPEKMEPRLEKEVEGGGEGKEEEEEEGKEAWDCLGSRMGLCSVP